MCCSHQCPTSRGGLSEAITMHLKIDFKFSCIFDRFLDDLGNGGGELWTTLGGPGRPLEASMRGVFDRVAPRESQRPILDDVGFILSGILEPF